MTGTPESPKETQLTFPCDFTIKVFGLASESFEASVLTMINHHVSNPSQHTIHSRASENGKYLALSVTVLVESKKQLDHIYQELSSSPLVLMAL